MSAPTAIIIGVGAEQGLGAGLARRFAAEGFHVLVAGRTRTKLETVVLSIEDAGGRASAIVTDATQEEDVRRLFERADFGDPGDPTSVVVYNAANFAPASFRDLSASAFEDAWRVGTYGGFLVGREAARRLTPLGRGTILFTGASASLRGRPGFAHFAAAKAGLRAVAQSMARELGPQGLHVAHVVIDGGIDGDRIRARGGDIVKARGEDGLLQIDDIAEAYWQIHRQSRSAWTHELDLRPFKESF